MPRHPLLSFFFFNDTATTEIYTLSLHDALPIYSDETDSHDNDSHDNDSFDLDFSVAAETRQKIFELAAKAGYFQKDVDSHHRSEEHTSELQSHLNLVCRLLLEKKKKQKHIISRA